MVCVVTAGPTYESLDQVRRLTNFSTGELGTRLAEFLSEQGHQAILLKGVSAVYPDSARLRTIIKFTTSADLADRLQALSKEPVNAVFHAAAVGDFAFGKIWKRQNSGELIEMNSGKISTKEGPYLAELVPTRKIIAYLREWFPSSALVGWKYEVDGDRNSALGLARRQLTENRLQATVANGPAYGDGFGLVTGIETYQHLPTRDELFERLASFQ
jgi:phosphopantothenoylcysteine synthetase/decarboxylase